MARADPSSRARRCTEAALRGEATRRNCGRRRRRSRVRRAPCTAPRWADRRRGHPPWEPMFQARHGPPMHSRALHRPRSRCSSEDQAGARGEARWGRPRGRRWRRRSFPSWWTATGFPVGRTHLARSALTRIRSTRAHREDRGHASEQDHLHHDRDHGERVAPSLTRGGCAARGRALGVAAHVGAAGRAEGTAGVRVAPQVGQVGIGGDACAERVTVRAVAETIGVKGAPQRCSSESPWSDARRKCGQRTEGAGPSDMAFTSCSPSRLDVIVGRSEA